MNIMVRLQFGVKPGGYLRFYADRVECPEVVPAKGGDRDRVASSTSLGAEGQRAAAVATFPTLGPASGLRGELPRLW